MWYFRPKVWQSLWKAITKWFNCFVILITVSAINCYQCQSNDDLECSEKFDEDFTKLRPESCDHVFEARYCIKSSGMFEGMAKMSQTLFYLNINFRRNRNQKVLFFSWLRRLLWLCPPTGRWKGLQELYIHLFFGRMQPFLYYLCHKTLLDFTYFYHFFHSKLFYINEM